LGPEGFAVRRVFGLLLVFAVCGGLAPVASVSKHLMKELPAPVYYHPTTVGAKWVYDDEGEDFVLIVSKVEDRKGTKVVSVERIDGEKRRLFALVEVSATSLVQSECGPRGDCAAPVVLLKAPMKIGDSWDFGSAAGKAYHKGTRVVVGVEKIKVPAGTFETVRIDINSTLVTGALAQKLEYSEWYAPNVGQVKWKWKDGGDIWSLKSFTPGKE
jgi:hypothetical protein